MAGLPIIPTENALQTTLDATFGAGATSATLADDWSSQLSGVTTSRPAYAVVDRVDTAGTSTPTKREYFDITGVSGVTITVANRGLSGSTDQSHSVGAVVEIVFDVATIQKIEDAFSTEHDPITGTHKPAPWVTATDDTTVTFDLSSGTKQKVTLTDNRTLALSNVVAGHVFILKLIQDATGSRIVTWFSTINWAGGSAPTLTTTATKADVFGFIQTATDTYDGFIIGQNV